MSVSNREFKMAKVLLVSLVLAAVPAFAGSWEYQAPFSFVASPSSSGVSAAGSQLFNSNPVVNIAPYTYTPNYGTAQNNSMMPMVMLALGAAPLLFKDQPEGSQSQKYQLGKDAPNGTNIKRGPAAIPLRKRYAPAGTTYSGDGIR